MQSVKVHGNEPNAEVLSAIIKAGERFSIIASQDIVDIRDIKLWAKGQPVTSSLQHRLLNRKLKHPLEACLAVEDGVTLFSLQEDLQGFLDGDSPLGMALRPWAPMLMKNLKQLPLHSVAQLLLTTALATRPDSLPHAVAAMALAGAAADGPTYAVDVRLAMLGGLLHDIGEVYIHPQYVDLEGPMDLVTHKHLIVHPRMAQMLLSTTTDYPEELCLAIGEHHERVNGSGYPARLYQHNSSALGRLLSVVETTLGIVRSPYAPITRASFALRVVPGEFDPNWTSFVCNLTRNVDETLLPDRSSDLPLEGSLLDHIDQRIEQTDVLKATLKAQGRDGPILDIVDTAWFRLTRLRVAWNALGFWGADAAELNPLEEFELELAHRELQQRLTQLQRECLLLAERLGELEKTWIEPLWRGVLLEPAR
ncbi:HD domain-containing phosphohydrolase [Rhodoferax sp.]|uniref:HD domain-containing phosphohydrolase n=1 Tax=Rhodoferax sp. TaxID=50421 RepID=UPI001EC770E5|nr:HD domain-containing phosphohydrolase [Rhodoferax sp.]MBT9506232.1 HD domain-containing protein [Rhodoferax sp.]